MLERETCGDGTVSGVHIGRAAVFCDAQENFGNTLVEVSTDATATPQSHVLKFEDLVLTTSWQPFALSHGPLFPWSGWQQQMFRCSAPNRKHGCRRCRPRTYCDVAHSGDFPPTPTYRPSGTAHERHTIDKV